MSVDWLQVEKQMLAVLWLACWAYFTVFSRISDIKQLVLKQGMIYQITFAQQDICYNRRNR